MACASPSTHGCIPQDSLGELTVVLSSLDDAALLARLQEYRPVGRQGYPLKALWRAYVVSFILNLPHTNALVRRLSGFGDSLSHRTTFNRFIQRLSYHPDLVDACFAGLTTQIKALLPDLGVEVVVDSTVVRSHCTPNRQPASDPEASWTFKNSTQAKNGGKEWRHDYKVHMVADASYGMPLTHVVTTAKRNDSPELPKVMDRAETLYPWFRPAAAMADWGYDSAANHELLSKKGILPIISSGAALAALPSTTASTPSRACPPALARSQWSMSVATRRRDTCTGARAVT